MNWTAVLQYAISGALVSWPVFIAGLLIGHHKARRHLEEVTERQTGDMKKMTDAQTGKLLARLNPGRPGTYQEDAGESEDRQEQGR